MIVPTNKRPARCTLVVLDMVRMKHGLKTRKQAEKLIMKVYGGFLFEALMFWLIDEMPIICE